MVPEAWRHIGFTAILLRMYNSLFQNFAYKDHTFVFIYKYANKLICILLMLFTELHQAMHLKLVSSSYHQNWPSYS